MICMNVASHRPAGGGGDWIREIGRPRIRKGKRHISIATKRDTLEERGM